MAPMFQSAAFAQHFCYRVTAALLLVQVTMGLDNPYQQVLAVPAGGASVSSSEASKSREFLVATFPDLKQVAYCQLPDNVWRPLVFGSLMSSKAIVADGARNRVFVADPTAGMIYWMNIETRSNGQIKTYGTRWVAVEGYAAQWLAVNSVGDLYFTGKATVDPPESSYDGVYRMDAAKIARKDALNPTEVYTRSNSGNPNPKVWMPSGIAVDSFYIYWGNQENGQSHGSVNKGSRQNTGTAATDLELTSINTAMEEVRGIAATGTTLFWVTPQGVYGQSKSEATTVTDDAAGLVVYPPADDTNSATFDPKSIAWDGQGSAYFTDYTAGRVYSFPAVNTMHHDVTNFVEAPGVWGVSVLQLSETSFALRSYSTWLPIAAAFVAMAASW